MLLISLQRYKHATLVFHQTAADNEVGGASASGYAST